MSTASFARWKLEEIKATRERAAPRYDFQISVDFSRSRADTESLTGFPLFLEAVRELEPDAEDWEWSESAICSACEKVGMNRRSIILRDEPKKEIIIQINNRRC